MHGYNPGHEEHIEPSVLAGIDSKRADTAYLTTRPELPVHKMEVVDIYAPRSAEEHETRQGIQSVIADFEKRLREGTPDEVASAIKDGRAFLEQSKTIREWKLLMTTAMALYPLQRPSASHMLDGVEIDDFARGLFLHGQDALGIRERGLCFSQLLKERDGQVTRVCSLASGASVPECDAIKNMLIKPEYAIFVDMDRRALNHVYSVAREAGIDLNRTAIDLVEANLVKDFMYARINHPKMPPESFDIVDALGITEYFDDKRVRIMLKKAYELVKPGGALIFGNMLDTHPTLLFNQKIVEWPGVIPRSPESLTEISREVAGHNDFKIYTTPSGVYGVVEINKPRVL